MKILKRFLDIFKNLYFVRKIYWTGYSYAKKLSFWITKGSVYIGQKVQIIGIDNILFGEHISIGDFCWININHRVKPDELVIGDKSHIGRNNFISVGDHLKIGEYFFSSCYCSIIGASHDKDPFNSYIASKVVNLGSGISIGANVFMGAHSKIIGGVNVGFGSIISAGAIVTKDVPPLSLVVGSPAKVVARFNSKKGEWSAAFDLHKVGDMSEEEYLQLVKNEKTKVTTPYHAASEKFGWI